MTKTELATLVPMSIEDMRERNTVHPRQYANSRQGGVLQLWFVDGLGKAHLLIISEIRRFGLDARWPRYMRSNLGIRTINQLR